MKILREIFDAEAVLFLLLLTTLIGIDSSYPLIHKILTYESYLLGIAMNGAIMWYIAGWFAPSIRGKNRELKNWFKYKYIWDEDQKKKHDKDSEMFRQFMKSLEKEY